MLQKEKKNVKRVLGYVKDCARTCTRRLHSKELFLAHLIWHIRELVKKI
jgi:hypothetical protein